MLKSKISNYNKFRQTKSLLQSYFGKSYSVPFFQLKLNSLRQEKGENIR